MNEDISKYAVILARITGMSVEEALRDLQAALNSFVNSNLI